MEIDREMVTDILIQVVFFLVTIGMFLAMTDVPKRILAKFRLRNRANVQAKRHFILGAQLVARARSAGNETTCLSLTTDAIEHADQALLLDPKDAALHILKALALDLQGHKAAALKSLDAALSQPAVNSLSDDERGDALFKRAELHIAVNRRRNVDSAVTDLVEALKLAPENSKAFCLLGQCYEQKEMKDEAKAAYEEAIKVDSNSAAALEGLERLAS